jgi:cobalt/nickel transport system permease protein
MHISEGILSLPILAGGGVTAVIGTAIGLKRIDNDHIMETALLSSAFFVASLIHIPLGPGSVHLVLNGLVGILLGWASVPAIATALFLQALLFGFGGLTVLGVNIVVMAAPAVAVSFLFGPMVRKPGKSQLLGAFLAGLSAILLSTLLLALALAGTDSSFLATAKLLLVAQLPLMLLEGLITLFVVSFLAKVQPDLLQLTIASTP